MPSKPTENKLAMVSEDSRSVGQSRAALRSHSIPLPSPKIVSSDGGSMMLVKPKHNTGPEVPQLAASPRATQQKYILEEHTYASDLQKIISRDFYNEGLHESVARDAPAVSLDVYQTNYTSDDNRSFNNLVSREKKRKVQQRPWLYNGKNMIEEPGALKANALLNDMSSQDHDSKRKAILDSWPALNDEQSLAPADKPSLLSITRSHDGILSTDRSNETIIKSNTRLAPGQKHHKQAKTVSDMPPPRYPRRAQPGHDSQKASYGFIMSPNVSDSIGKIRRPSRPMLSPAGIRMLENITRRKPGPRD